MEKIIYKPIGIIHSAFKKPKGTPIQPTAGKKAEGMVEIYPEYADGLKDLEGFSHIILVYHFHLSKEASLVAKPFMDDNLHGIFAIRGPARPNPIGLSVTRLLSVDGTKIHIQGIDIVDGTPLLDIKPYVPEFDSKEKVRTGWLEKNLNKLPDSKDDGRFSE
ncbi:MAG: tRNA (N6-threonylcarbamoyladenosine(37)-N6)-methyltransferase TrmO [Bacteroidota bacterium]